MPIIVEWGNEEHTIIHVRTEGTYTWEEYHDTTEAVVAMLNDQIRGIVNIWEEGATMPQGNPLPHFRRMVEDVLGKYDLITVNVGHKGYEQMVVEIAAKAIPQLKGKIVYANSTEDAHRLILSS